MAPMLSPVICSRRIYFLSAMVVALLSACVNTKKTGLVLVKKNQQLYESGSTGNPIDGTQHLYAFNVTLTKTEQAFLTTNADGSMSPNTIQFTNPDIDNSFTTNDPNKPPAGAVLANKAFYFPQDQNPHNPQIIGPGSNSFTSVAFRYTDIRPVWQALTIPIKYRPPLSGGRASDASASVTLGPSYGWKFTQYSYRRIYALKERNARTYSKLNDHTTQWAVTPGIFLAPTVVALDSLHTRGKITTAKNVVGTTYGIFCVFGYNDVNLGLAVGVDNTYGSAPGSWWYNGKPWIGAVFSIDFFK